MLPTKLKLQGVQTILIFFVISAILNCIFFFGIADHEFVFSGDQFFRFTAHEAFTKSFFLRKPIDLGVFNGWQFATEFWDSIYYIFVYSLKCRPETAEKILFFIVLWFSQFFAFLGFRRWAPKFHLIPDSMILYAVTFWYCFNPYTLELWHGGAYNLGSGLTYSLAPLIFYHFDRALFTSTDRKKIIACALCLAAASFTFWLVAPLVLFLSLFAIFRLINDTSKIKLFIKNAFFLGITYLPMVSFVLFGIMHEYFNRTGDNNAVFSPTYGNLQGGVWYQLLMLFSWGIYTVWTPRSLYPFGEYFFSIPYITGIFLLYSLIVIGLVAYIFRKRLKGRSLVVFQNTNLWPHPKVPYVSGLSLIFAISIFLAKGAQPPWGAVFDWLYNYVPFFSVFRTPDIRFGFIIVLSLSFLLLFVSQIYSKRVAVWVILAFTAMQAWPLFSGIAVRGQNISGKYYDRIVHLPEDYKAVAEYINRGSRQGTYVLPIPAIEYGVYSLDDNEHLVGQDMLAKMIDTPFMYISSTGGMAEKTYSVIREIFSSKNYSDLSKFPVRFLLLRSDIACADCPSITEEQALKIGKKVLENPTFKLFEMNQYPSLIDSPNVTFEMVNSVEYRVKFSHLSEAADLSLLQNFHENWKLFSTEMRAGEGQCNEIFTNLDSKTQECLNGQSLIKADDWKFLTRSAIFEETHQLKWGYANAWTVSPKVVLASFPTSDFSVNPDGSLNFVLTLYYSPQLKYLSFAVISLLSVIIAMSFVICDFYKKQIKMSFDDEQ